MLTSEGGRLKQMPPLIPGRDFQLVPEPVWKTLSQWYGGSPALPRTVSMISGRFSPQMFFAVMVVEVTVAEHGLGKNVKLNIFGKIQKTKQKHKQNFSGDTVKCKEPDTRTRTTSNIAAASSTPITA